MNDNSSTYYMDSSEIASSENKINSSLNDSSSLMTTTQETLNGFLDSSLSKLTGEAWDAVRDDLKTYSDCLEYAQQLNNLVLQANEEYFQTIQKFLEPDMNLNTADLPKFEADKAQLEAEIKSLEAENTELAKVPKTIIVQDGVDENGNPIMKEVPNPAYAEAQQKIADNNARIENVLKPELNEKIRLINKINEFTNVILPALDKKLDEVAAKVNEFKQKIQEIALAVGDDGTAPTKYDMDTKEGRMVYIYDQLTQKYGFSEWGAKAIIAHMYRENGEFIADRFQGGGGPNAGYGLIQWEYAKYGGWTNRAQDMEEWCAANGFDHKTIDGQLAFLNYDIETRAASYNSNLYEELKTATADDYIGVGTRFGTYIIGNPNATNSYNRLQDGYVKYTLFPFIDNRNTTPSLTLPETPELKKFQFPTGGSETTTTTTTNVTNNNGTTTTTTQTTNTQNNYNDNNSSGYYPSSSVSTGPSAAESAAPRAKKATFGTCPICGGKLVMKYDTNGVYLGCSNEPTCSYSQRNTIS